jgi:tetratricopeptide (TPR) repeat protein
VIQTNRNSKIAVGIAGIVILIGVFALVLYTPSMDTADRYLHERDYQSALHEYNLVFNDNPDNDMALYGIAVCLHRLGREEESREYEAEYNRRKEADFYTTTGKHMNEIGA